MQFSHTDSSLQIGKKFTLRGTKSHSSKLPNYGSQLPLCMERYAMVASKDSPLKVLQNVPKFSIGVIDYDIKESHLAYFVSLRGAKLYWIEIFRSVNPELNRP
jgi:hypothetical protein